MVWQEVDNMDCLIRNEETGGNLILENKEYYEKFFFKTNVSMFNKKL